jgi:hypothetical protein
MMGCIVIASSFLSVFVKIPLHAGLLRGEDNLTVIQARDRYRRHRGLVDASRHGTHHSTTNMDGGNVNVSSMSWRRPEEVDTATAGSVELGNAASYSEPKDERSESPDIVSESEGDDVAP